MRISDWSSDVCSSDLTGTRGHDKQRGKQRQHHDAGHLHGKLADFFFKIHAALLPQALAEALQGFLDRAAVLIPLGDQPDRKSVGKGKGESVRVDLGGRGLNQKKINRYSRYKVN